MGKYEDIINLPYQKSLRHPQMSMMQRAAQFAPFSALSGYEELISEASRITSEMMELSSERKEQLSKLLTLILKEKAKAWIVYFHEDAKKSGGAYKSIEGYPRKVETGERKLIMQSGEQISLDSIVNIRKL